MVAYFLVGTDLGGADGSERTPFETFWMACEAAQAALDDGEDICGIVNSAGALVMSGVMLRELERLDDRERACCIRLLVQDGLLDTR